MGPIKVLCVVPRGLAGRGGIETLFSHADEALRADPASPITMRFVDSRGDASGPAWVLHFPVALARYAYQLAAWRPDVVHLNAATNASAWRKRVMQAMARLSGAATVVHFHGSAFPEPGERRGRWVGVLRGLFARADAIVVLGPVWRDFLARFYRASPERFTVVANGVADFAPNAPAPRAPEAPVQLLFAGNLTDAKGAGVLLDALHRLSPDLPSWRATFAGTGDVERFRARAAAGPYAPRIVFTGWVGRDTILPLYAQADVVVLPSRNEVLPVCLIEGACAGAALVATPVGSVPDVLVDGENGVLVRADDPASVAAALSLLIADAPKREAFRRRSRDLYAERFRLDAMLARLTAVYRAALLKRR